MAVTKYAISMPEDVMKQIDRAARKRGETRSRFIANILRRAAQARSDAEITEQLNRVFADESLAAEQRETAEAFRRGSSTRGTKW